MSRALRTDWYGRAARMALACVVGVAVAIAGAASARADDSQGGKKQAGMAAKEAARARLAKEPEAAAEARMRWQRELDRRIGKKPGTVINIYNNWTHEYLPVPADALASKRRGRRGRDAAAPPVVPAERVNEFLRCHFTNQPTNMDARLIHTLVSAAVHFNVTRINIISGYRSDKYNLILRKKGREVARNSQHTKGHAVDFRLPGVSTERLHAWAKRLRLGGVGRYLKSGFIHVDTGRVRYWDGR